MLRRRLSDQDKKQLLQDLRYAPAWIADITTSRGAGSNLTMDDYFALSPDEQRGYCEMAAAQIKLDAPSIEKDFWVCWIYGRRFSCRRLAHI